MGGTKREEREETLKILVAIIYLDSTRNKWATSEQKFSLIFQFTYRGMLCDDANDVSGGEKAFSLFLAARFWILVRWCVTKQSKVSRICLLKNLCIYLSIVVNVVVSVFISSNPRIFASAGNWIPMSYIYVSIATKLDITFIVSHGNLLPKNLFRSRMNGKTRKNDDRFLPFTNCLYTQDV